VVRRKKQGDITIRLRGSAGQSLGAFLTNGIKIEVFGDSNDYVGKGLSGGMITLRPRPQSKLVAAENTIIGNTCLYGATSGKLFAAGQAGERFAVRNSGAISVVEGCGSNGCEYMTGGTVVILGAVGDNFGAGMTGGMAFVYDVSTEFSLRANMESIVVQNVQTDYWAAQLECLLKEHITATQSLLAQKILESWEFELPKFLQICPKEMVSRLAYPL
jgi:glutamate synthase (NADPH/NADH) large chain